MGMEEEFDKKFEEERKKDFTKRVDECFGNFCGLLSGQLDKTRALACIVENCPLGLSCLATTQASIMISIWKKRDGEEWKGD
jgi:hypothetical protein